MSPTTKGLYTTELSKGQGAVDETLSVLEVWQPGMPADELARTIHNTGALSRSTAVRTRDLVQRVFSRRYLVDNAAPAAHLKYLLAHGADRNLVKQLMLIY